jgi:hypothetical protein
LSIVNAIKLLLPLLVGCSFVPFSARAQDKLWGAGLHLGGSKSSFDAAEIALTELGANTFRDDLYWQNLEQTRGKLVEPQGLIDLQKLLLHGAQHDMKGVIVLTYGNPLYFPGLPKTDGDRQAFTRYAGWVARGYGKQVSAFEVWNEWNIGGGSEPRTQGSAEDYVKLLRAVRPVLRAEAPGVPVIAGAVANRELGWIKSFADKGGFALCDGFSVHPYNHHDRDASAEDVVSWLDGLHREIKSHTKKSMPLWITEIGWPNHDGEGGSPEAVTAQRLLKMNLLLLSRGYVRGVWWYDLFDDGHDHAEMEDNFGLIRMDGSRKPAFEAFKLFLKHFKKAKFVKDLSAHGALALEFKSADGRRLLAAWAREGVADERLVLSGSYKSIPVEGGDSARVARELKKGGSAPLGEWPALFELAKDAKVSIVTTSVLGGCAKQ